MATFADRAMPTAQRGVPVIRLRPRSKAALDMGWPDLATTDDAVIARWNQESPEANCGAVAKAISGGVWFLEIDDPSVPGRIESETGQKIPLTYRVRSRPGRGHYYWRQTPESIALGNVAQNYVKHEDFSVRVDSEYVVAAGSLHPNTGNPYEVVCNAPIAEAPSWLIEWIKNQKLAQKPAAIDDGEPIPEGRRNSMLASIAGKLRNAGLSREDIEEQLFRVNERRCHPPMTDNEIKTIAASISRYPIGKDDTVLIGGVPVGSGPSKTAYGVEPASPLVEPAERPVLTLPPYPEFPRWVMEGTSIYEGLVKPYCAVNSRYPEYMFMPAMAILLNYVATKVNVKGKLLIPSLFMVLIGRRGVVIKSSSVESAIQYMHEAGVADHAKEGLLGTAGKSLIWEIGSPEGLGLEMSRIKCKNAVLFYDELSTLTNKASIEGSTLTSKLLTLYESGKFQNTIKAKKDTYSFDPNSYCVSLIACCTDKNFLPNWGKLAGHSTGLDDRFFFLYQPKTLIPLEPQVHVETMVAAQDTRKLLEKAVRQGVYEIENSSPLSDNIGMLGNRGEIRAEKFALGFAIDLGLDTIDLECIERGIALVEYEQAVKKWLSTYEANTREGMIQMEIKNVLVRNGGRLIERDLKRELHSDRFGTSLWNQAFVGLIKDGQIIVEGTGHRDDPRYVQLIVMPQEED